MEKIGILKYIAAGGAKGVIFEDQPKVWYNPTQSAKEQVKTEYKGKQVKVQLVDGKTEFTSMTLLETKTEQPKVQEESIGETVKNEEPAHSVPETGGYTQRVYHNLEKTKLETAKKGGLNLTYASWAESWGSLKRAHPTSTFEVHENKNGLPYFMGEEPKMGAFVKVSVTVLGITHTVHLPVMNHMNKSIMKEEMTTFDVNKNIQRALAKGIALHGLGLYVFRGEDYPEEQK